VRCLEVWWKGWNKRKKERMTNTQVGENTSVLKSKQKQINWILRKRWFTNRQNKDAGNISWFNFYWLMTYWIISWYRDENEKWFNLFVITQKMGKYSFWELEKQLKTVMVKNWICFAINLFFLFLIFIQTQFNFRFVKILRVGQNKSKNHCNIKMFAKFRARK